MSIDVGVVIPAYNAAAFIVEALDSVAAQTLPAAQVTVVNDGSSDGTGDLVRDWIKTHSGVPVMLLENQPNRGLSSTRNQAIAATQTELIATLDADDLFQPTHLERLTEPLKEEPDVVLAFGDIQEFTAEGDLAGTFLSRVGRALWALEAEHRTDYRILSGAVFRSLLPGNYIPVSSMVFRREAAIRAGLYDPGLPRAEDRDFVLRMARTGRFAYCPVVAGRKRIHPDNISGPKYHLLMADGAFGALLRAKALVRDGSEADRQRVDQELERAAEVLLYSASVSSLTTLSRVTRELRGHGYPLSALQPRAWLRACWLRITGRHGAPGLPP